MRVDGRVPVPGEVLGTRCDARALQAVHECGDVSPDEVGVEEGAVRSIAAGADVLCLGHDLFDESVVAVRDALVGAVRSGRVSEHRLAEAAGRVTALNDIRGVASVDRESGREAAGRALRVDGDARIDGPALIVELVPEAGMAAGRLAQFPGDWFAAVSGGELRRYEDAPTDTPDSEGRRLVVIVRDAHRFEWERRAIAALTAEHPDAIVVEIGLPHWRPAHAGAFVSTYGAARVNLEAAAEALYSEPATRGGAVR